MSGLGSLLLTCAWATGLVAGILTVRAFEEVTNAGEPRRRPPLVLCGAVLASLWLPWVTGAGGGLTLNGWLALDAATVVAVVLLVAGIGALAALPDHGGPHRDLLSMVLALSLLGIVGGNVAIGASGAWGNELTWGAGITLAATLALAAGETAHHRGWYRRRAEGGADLDLTAELHRLHAPHPF